MACAGDDDPTVYITKTGTKYHRESCSYLQTSKIPVSLSSALADGYGACSRCKPLTPTVSSPVQADESPSSDEDISAPRDDVKNLYRVDVENLDSFLNADTVSMLRAEVAECVDGDTIKVKIASPPESLDVRETIRLIGVDTPETVHPQKPVERFGKEASDFTRMRLENRTVYLAFDWNLRDVYDRLLAYVYTEDGACHNAEIISNGSGFAYTEFPFHFMDEFTALERSARESNAGLWQDK